MPRSRHAVAGMALVAATVVPGAAVAPPPPSPPALSVASTEVRLAAASSIFNIPANLLIDIINIPYNEVRAMDYTARAFIFSGPWFVVSATNVWGVDQGDPPKFMSVVNTLVPFPALSGMDLDQFDQNGLGQQVWMLAAVELPTSEFCAGTGCAPLVPAAPITGLRAIDGVIWAAAILAGQVKFPQLDNWLKVPISDVTSGYTFGPDYPGRVSPAGRIFPGFGFTGTTLDPVTGEHIEPWNNTTFTLDLSKPLANYFDHLMADPSTNPIRLPDLEQSARAIQSLAAALVVAFWPITPGSVFCPGDCSQVFSVDYPAIAKFIGDIYPGNAVIDEWLDAYENGTANVPTQQQIDHAVEQKGKSFWTFGNPSPPADWQKINLSGLAPHFHALWTALGLKPPPIAADSSEEMDSQDSTDGPTNDLQALRNVSTAKADPPATDIAPAETKATDAAPVPDDGDPSADQTSTTDTAQHGNVTGSSRPRHAAEHRVNAADVISRVFERVTKPATKPGYDTGGARGVVDFSTGAKGGIASQAGAKRPETSTGDTAAGDTDSGHNKADDSGTGGRH